MDQEPTRIPEDVLTYSEYCVAQVGYVLALALGRDDDTRAFIEARLTAGLAWDRKVKLLGQLMETYRPDVWQEPPYSTLAIELRELMAFRDKVAHSQPDRGDRLRRLVREGARNDVVIITATELAEQLDRGMRCQSALAFLPVYLEQHLAPPPAPQP